MPAEGTRHIRAPRGPACPALPDVAAVAAVAASRVPVGMPDPAHLLAEAGEGRPEPGEPGALGQRRSRLDEPGPADASGGPGRRTAR